MRIVDTTVVQTLHLMNAPSLDKKVRNDNGKAAKLAASKMSPQEIVEELYLLVYARFPQATEMRAGIARIAPLETGGKGRRRRRRQTITRLVRKTQLIPFDIIEGNGKGLDRQMLGDQVMHLLIQCGQGFCRVRRCRYRIYRSLSGFCLFSRSDVTGDANAHLFGCEPLGRPHDVDDMTLFVDVAVLVIA